MSEGGRGGFFIGVVKSSDATDMGGVGAAKPGGEGRDTEIIPIKVIFTFKYN